MEKCKDCGDYVGTNPLCKSCKIPADKSAMDMFANRKIKSVYSGKPGCCCGCRGNHTYTVEYALSLTEEKKKKLAMTLKFNDTVVKKIVATIKGIISQGTVPDVDQDYIAVQTDTRLYVVYFI
jgi:hypothetical protein